MNSIIRNILCKLGFHNWRFWAQYHYNTDRRFCRHCDKKEERRFPNGNWKHVEY